MCSGACESLTRTSFSTCPETPAIDPGAVCYLLSRPALSRDFTVVIVLSAYPELGRLVGTNKRSIAGSLGRFGHFPVQLHRSVASFNGALFRLSKFVHQTHLRTAVQCVSTRPPRFSGPSRGPAAAPRAARLHVMSEASFALRSCEDVSASNFAIVNTVAREWNTGRKLETGESSCSPP
jgi:hypothetical protein